MSAYCSHAGYNGAASWLEMQYEEEHAHATRIFNYLIDQGVQVGIGGIDAPRTEFGSLLEVFEASLAHEQDQTARLNDLSNQALNEKMVQRMRGILEELLPHLAKTPEMPVIVGSSRLRVSRAG